MEDKWYWARRYGVLWNVFASKAKFKKGKFARHEKAMHLVLNELRQRGEQTAIEAWHAMAEDYKLPYDKERIDALIADFMEKHPEAQG